MSTDIIFKDSFRSIAVENEAARDTAYKAFNIKQIFSFLNIKDEYFEEDKKDPMYARFKRMDLADEQGIKLGSPEFHKIEVGFCTKCKEWTGTDEPCCGSEYVHID